MKIKFNIISEIRHGSPYNLAELIIEGNEQLKINKTDNWQDVIAWSKDRKNFALVQWNTDQGEPSFNIFLFDSINGLTKVFNDIIGCCHELTFDKNKNLLCEIFTQTNVKGKHSFGVVTKKLTTNL